MIWLKQVAVRKVFLKLLILKRAAGVTRIRVYGPRLAQADRGSGDRFHSTDT